MIQVFEVDKQGTILKSLLEQDDFEESDNLKRGWVGYFLKPQFSRVENKWFESATEDELKAAHAYVESNEEQLAQQVSALEISNIEKEVKISDLGKQNEELGQQLSDLEIQILGGI